MPKPFTPEELRAIERFPKRRIKRIPQGEFADPGRFELWLIKRPKSRSADEHRYRRVEQMILAGSLD